MRKLIRGVAIILFSAGVLFMLIAPYASFGSGRILPGKIAEKISELNKGNAFKTETKIFSPASKTPDVEISKVVSDYTLLNINTTRANDVISTKPEYLKMTIPFDNNGGNFVLLLYKVDISSGGFTLMTSDGLSHPVNDIVHYRGSIAGDAHSVVSISFMDDEMTGLISNGAGNYVVGKIRNSAEEKHIIYNDKNIISKSTFNCETVSSIPQNYTRYDSENSDRSVNCIHWYWETDYDIFLNKGSVANVNTWMQGIFNQVSTLYANDGISIALQTLFIWTSIDPYTGPSTGSYLSQFGAYRTSFSGDLAHLIGLNGNGGIAYINGICSSNMLNRMGYSGVSATYNNVPVYSWTVENITHEEGHLLGSNHTHDCAWNGNFTKIDSCGDAAGYPGTGFFGCPVPPAPISLPSAGGTIMSYCHLTSAGINFSLGFGQQPRDRILNYVNAATCLTSCSGCPTPPQPGPITGSASVCQGTSQNYSVSPVTGATSYTWTLPSGWTGTSTTNSITTTAGSSGGTISVTANNSCGSSPARILAVTVSAIPAQPGTISGNASVCQGSLQTYSVPAVSGVTSYTWTRPGGWTGSSTTNSISVTAGNSGGTISVKANNACGSGPARTKSVSVITLPAQPGTISGNASVCQSSTRTYSVNPVTGATGYTWTLPSGWTGTSTTNSINVTAGSTGGTISVRANNACGSGPVRTKSVSVTPLPAQPGNISGNTSVIPYSVQTYSIGNVAGATGYSWTLQSGWTGSSTTTSITVTVGTTSGNIFVAANNTCGSSLVQSLFISMSPLPVELLSFTAHRINNNVQLNWTTATEIDNDYFMLEKSADGFDFESVANIDGAGNSASLLNYTFLDEHPLKGVSYYRLKQTDFNGDYTYSNMVSVCFEREAKFEIYPNPASSIVTVSCDSNTPNKIIIYDGSGRMVMVKDNIYDLYQFDISFLPAGYYVIIINQGTCIERQKKFIKN